MKQMEESLATTENTLKEARTEAKALAKQMLGVEQAMHSATEEIQARLSHLCPLHLVDDMWKLKGNGHKGSAGLQRKIDPFPQQGPLHARQFALAACTDSMLEALRSSSDA